VQESLNPPIYGWNNVRCPDFVAQEQIVLQAGARKYEAGTFNLLGMLGLIRGMELLLEVGVENVGRELARKRTRLAAALQAKGYTVLGADAPPETASGIVSCHRPGADLAPLHRKLLEARVVTSLRTDRAGRKYLRLSPHFYNTDAELDRALESF
jgi:selenocysteine lyase/cysteine desulfurase